MSGEVSKSHNAPQPKLSVRVCVCVYGPWLANSPMIH